MTLASVTEGPMFSYITGRGEQVHTLKSVACTPTAYTLYFLILKSCICTAKPTATSISVGVFPFMCMLEMRKDGIQYNYTFNIGVDFSQIAGGPFILDNSLVNAMHTNTV